MSLNLKEKILKVAYRAFMYFIPCGIALYIFVAEKLLNKEVSYIGKIGVTGMFIVVVMFIIAVFFLGKHFKKQISKVSDQILVCMNNEQKEALIIKKKKIESFQELFSNIIFITPFVIFYFALMLVEKQAISLRGIFGTIAISMAIGLGFNGLKQYLHIKGAKSIDEDNE